VLLKELNLIDKKLIKKEYDMLSDHYKIHTRNEIENHINYTCLNKNLIGHKEILKKLRNDNKSNNIR
jgi:hypothetical protein